MEEKSRVEEKRGVYSKEVGFNVANQWSQRAFLPRFGLSLAGAVLNIEEFKNQRIWSRQESIMCSRHFIGFFQICLAVFSLSKHSKSTTSSLLRHRNQPDSYQCYSSYGSTEMRYRYFIE